jgi:hypothetical protein
MHTITVSLNTGLSLVSYLNKVCIYTIIEVQQRGHTLHCTGSELLVIQGIVIGYYEGASMASAGRSLGGCLDECLKNGIVRRFSGGGPLASSFLIPRSVCSQF